MPELKDSHRLAELIDPEDDEDKIDFITQELRSIDLDGGEGQRQFVYWSRTLLHLSHLFDNRGDDPMKIIQEIAQGKVVLDQLKRLDASDHRRSLDNRHLLSDEAARAYDAMPFGVAVERLLVEKNGDASHESLWPSVVYLSPIAKEILGVTVSEMWEQRTNFLNLVNPASAWIATFRQAIKLASVAATEGRDLCSKVIVPIGRHRRRCIVSTFLSGTKVYADSTPQDLVHLIEPYEDGMISDFSNLEPTPNAARRKSTLQGSDNGEETPDGGDSATAKE